MTKAPKMTLADRIECFFMSSLYFVSKKWSAELNKMMNAGIKVEPEGYGGYTVKIGKYIVWVSNYPYAYGSDHGEKYGGDIFLPDCATRVRLKHYIATNKPKSKWED